MIERIFHFLKILYAFQGVERLVRHVGTDKMENDAEHSYQLAMLAWYIIDSEKLDLDRNIVFKYALVHDFVEVYAGDVPFYRSDEEDRKKKEREKESQKRLSAEYQDFPELHEYIEKYEQQEDEESKFVYALDKLLPAMTIYLDKGRLWKEHKISFEQLVKSKNSKIQSLEIRKYWDELREILAKNKQMFHVEHE